MILKEWQPGQSLKEFGLNHSAFWVQIHGCPLEMMTLKNANKIGKGMRNLLEFGHSIISHLAIKDFLG